MRNIIAFLGPARAQTCSKQHKISIQTGRCVKTVDVLNIDKIPIKICKCNLRRSIIETKEEARKAGTSGSKPFRILWPRIF